MFRRPPRTPLIENEASSSHWSPIQNAAPRTPHQEPVSPALPMRRKSVNSSKTPEKSPRRRGRLRRCVLPLLVGIGTLACLWVYLPPLSTPPPPTYVCPSPLRPRPPSLLPQHLSPPIPLPSHPDFPLFQLTLSYDTTVCNAFHLDVARRDQGACRRAMATRAAFDPALDAEIKQTMSPDTIHVQLDGAERLAVDRPTSFDPVACSTRFSFRLANPGPVFLNASLLYSDFDALKDVHAAEHSRPKPRLLMTPLVPHPLQLSVCKPSCAPHQPFSPHIPPSSTYPQLYTPFLSPCNSSASQQGAFVPASSFDLVYPSSSIQVPISNSRPTTGLYTYVSQGCAWAHDGLRFRDHSSCTRAPSRHLLVGDSHARSLFDVVANRLDGSDEVTLVSAKGSKKRRQIGELGMEFHWDPHLTTNFTCATLRDTSSITISTGTHQLSWNCPSLSTHVAHLTRILTSLSTLLSTCDSSTPTALILLTIPMFHPQLHNLDCRTGPRISSWNDAARRLANSHGWTVVDMESYTRPVAIDTLLMDGVHYLKTDAMDPIADELIHAMGMCGGP